MCQAKEYSCGEKELFCEMLCIRIPGKCVFPLSSRKYMLHQAKI